MEGQNSNSPQRQTTCSAGTSAGSSRLKHPGQLLKWQAGGPCSERCLAQCATSENRFYCAQRVRGSYFEFVNATDGVLLAFRGEVEPVKYGFKRGVKPVYTVPRAVAPQNARGSKAYCVAGTGEDHLKVAEEDSLESHGGAEDLGQDIVIQSVVKLRPEARPSIHPAFGLGELSSEKDVDPATPSSTDADPLEEDEGDVELALLSFEAQREADNDDDDDIGTSAEDEVEE
eukprot:g8924.t1